MIIKGKSTEAKIFASVIDEHAIQSIKNIVDLGFLKGAQISIMPDVHKCSDIAVVGYVQKGGKIAPSLISADIGCGMTVTNLGKVDIDLEKFDKVVKEVDKGSRKDFVFDKWDDFTPGFKKVLNKDKAIASVSIGGGNHFNELDKDTEGNIYFITHSGSRNLGGQVYKYYQEIAYKNSNGIGKVLKEKKNQLISLMKDLGLSSYINDILRAIPSTTPEKVNKERSWLEGDDLKNYIHDLQICVEFGSANRKYLQDKILRELGLEYIDRFETIHNYIDKENVVRKGSISAHKDEIVYIPLSMRDGGIIAKGKGNPEYLESAPHGAGRLMSRVEAKKLITLDEFKESMKGIYTSTVDESTLDESYAAYKSLDDIKEYLEPTVEIIKQIKPIYNFKVGEEDKVW